MAFAFIYRVLVVPLLDVLLIGFLMKLYRFLAGL